MRIGFRLTAALAAGFLFFFAGLPCSADENAPMDALCDTADSLDIPESVQEYLDDAGISADEPASVLTLSPSELLHTAAGTIANEAAAPLRLCGMLLTLSVLSALFGSLGDTADHHSMRSHFAAICTLLCVGSAAEPLCSCILRTAAMLRDGQLFMSSYVPVFAAFLAAGGSVAGGASYQVFVLFLTEGIMQLANGILFPLLQMSAALGIADAVNPKLKLSGFVSGIRSGVTWLLGFVMTMFSALLSVRSFVASAADSLAAKSVRLLSSSLIPVVGSAVSDAYGTVQGSIHLLRNGIGAVGMLVLIWLTVPPLISLLLYRLAFRISGFFADSADAEAMKRLCENADAVLAAVFAIQISFAVMMIFSSAIFMLLIGN